MVKCTLFYVCIVCVSFIHVITLQISFCSTTACIGSRSTDGVFILVKRGGVGEKTTLE